RDRLAVLSIESFDDFVASIVVSIASGQTTLPRRDLHPPKYTNLHDTLPQLTTVVNRCDVFRSQIDPKPLCAKGLRLGQPLALLRIGFSEK
ncbi:MAG TPA: hypothetical protein VGZ26_01485, partial [Pirellulales bacterium]|nr:hypothetical protein [Pirellulales bacterium]